MTAPMTLVHEFFFKISLKKPPGRAPGGSAEHLWLGAGGGASKKKFAYGTLPRIRTFCGVRYGRVGAKRVGGYGPGRRRRPARRVGGYGQSLEPPYRPRYNSTRRARTGRARACARACAGTQGPGGLCGHALRGEHDCRRVTSRRLHRANTCRTTGRPNTTVTVRARVVGWGVGGYGPAGQRRRPVRVGGYGRGARAPTLPYHTPQKVRTLAGEHIHAIACDPNCCHGGSRRRDRWSCCHACDFQRLRALPRPRGDDCHVRGWRGPRVPLLAAPRARRCSQQESLL